MLMLMLVLVLVLVFSVSAVHLSPLQPSSTKANHNQN
jgi:hypothetical protein